MKSIFEKELDDELISTNNPENKKNMWMNSGYNTIKIKYIGE